MTTIVDLDTGGVLGIVAGRDSEGVGDWLFARPLRWRLGVKVVAIDQSAAFRKALRMWLPRTAVSVDAFHLVKLGNDMLTEVRQRLTLQVHGRRGRSVDPVWAKPAAAPARCAETSSSLALPTRTDSRRRPPRKCGSFCSTPDRSRSKSKQRTTKTRGAETGRYSATISLHLPAG